MGRVSFGLAKRNQKTAKMENWSTAGANLDSLVENTHFYPIVV